MARNGTGSYALPAGNPVISGTTVSSAWGNSTLNDIAAELTDSLSRSGKGGMSAQLKLADGTAAFPGVTFNNDTDSGMYRAAANDLRMSLGGTEVSQWTPTGFNVFASVSSTANFRAANGTAAIPAYGFTADTDSGMYSAGPDDVRMAITGADVLRLLSSGATVTGSLNVTSTIVSKQISATGNGVSSGGVFANGTAATGAIRQSACALTNGDLDMAGVVNPDASAPLTNRLTPASFVKAWARLQTNGAGGVSILGGMNVASAAVGGAGAYIALTLASPMTDAVNHAVNIEQYAVGALVPIECYGASINGPPYAEVRIYGTQLTIAPVVGTAINFATSVRNLFVTVAGRQ